MVAMITIRDSRRVAAHPRAQLSAADLSYEATILMGLLLGPAQR